MIERLYFDNPNGQSFHYMLYTPEAWKGMKMKRPLVVFLHGYGERGPNDGGELDKVFIHGYPKAVKNGAEYPFMIAAPQCPTDSKHGNLWSAYIESLDVFLDHLIATQPVDTKRISLTGISMGGSGAWLWGCCSPERFAAIAPVCGTGLCWRANAFTNIPVWAFHGDQDTIIPPEESLAMVKRINAIGGNAKLTLYHGVAHNSWDNAYSEHTLIEWFKRARLPAH